MCIKDILELKNFKEFEKYILHSKSICTIIKIIKDNLECCQFIINNTSYVPEDATIYYRLIMILNGINNYNDLPKCNHCGKLLDDCYLNKYFKGNHIVYCSLECYRNHPKSLETIEKISKRMKKQWAEKDDEYKKAFYEKVALTNMERYGTKCTLNTEENICKKKATWGAKYGKGVDNPLKAKSIKDKVLKTNIERYGSACPLNNDIIKDKAKLTLIERYGVESPMQSEEIVQKMRDNAIKKYGVNWSSKSDEAWKKYCATIDKNHFVRPKYHKYHTYKYLSGKEIIILGYEDIALDFYILKKYNEDDIENSISYMSKLNIKYDDENGNEHRYIPDFYIKSENLIIEVKSKFTFYMDLNKILLKTKASIDAGYNICTLVFEHIDRNKKNIKYKIYSYEDIKIEKEKYC